MSLPEYTRTKYHVVYWAGVCVAVVPAGGIAATISGSLKESLIAVVNVTVTAILLWPLFLSIANRFVRSTNLLKVGVIGSIVWLLALSLFVSIATVHFKGAFMLGKLFL